jgi:glutaredoxin-like protein
MALLNNELKQQLQDILNQMKDEVTVALFTAEDQCETCSETKSFMEEVAEVGKKVTLEQYDYGIKFNGIPAGHEINSFITGLIEVSGSGEELPDAFKTRLDKINKPVHIKVFVTLGCPHCPGAVSKAHKLALENDFITAEMIEAQTFNAEANKYNVSGVPKIVINEDHDLVGNQPIESFMEIIEAL